MTSIQTPTTAWMAYSEETILPPPSRYVGPYRAAKASYTDDLTSLDPKEPDSLLIETLAAFTSPFLVAYYGFDRAFGADDHYTLFLPMNSSTIDSLLQLKQNSELGFSYKDRKYKTEAKSRIEEILMNHMVPVKINPRQIEYRNTRLSALNGTTIHMNEYGQINEGRSAIQQYITLPNSTIFFITEEIL
jgi:hypothetical protein